MKHTYFFKSMNWTATGIYYDDSGKQFDLSGEVSIVHSDSQWSLGGYLEVAFETPVRFTNDYTIADTQDPVTLAWQSYNPALGVLKGKFEIVREYILSSYVSDNGEYSGTETLIQINEHTYNNVGISFHNGEKMSAWTAVITASDKT